MPRTRKSCLYPLPFSWGGEGGLREKVREAIDLHTGSFVSRGVEGRRNSSGGGVKGGGRGPSPAASWAENTIMTECTQKSGHPPVYVLSTVVCGEGVPLLCKPLLTMDERS
jgi:hypothetical protein